MGHKPGEARAGVPGSYERKKLSVGDLNECVLQWYFYKLLI
jgi:hypothetical protein